MDEWIVGYIERLLLGSPLLYDAVLMKDWCCVHRVYYVSACVATRIRLYSVFVCRRVIYEELVVVV